MSGSSRRFLAAILLIVVAPLCSKAEEASTGVDQSLVIEQFDIYNDGDLLLVPVTAFGKTRMFAVDTGCSRMLYDKSLRPFLGELRKEVTLRTGFGRITAEQFDSPEAHLGKLSLRTEQPVDCCDLRGIKRLCGHNLEGCIGMAMLLKHVVHIDFDAGKLSFLKQAPPNAGERFKLSNWKDIPAITAELGGSRSEFFLIDTGFSSYDAGSLFPVAAAALQEQELARESELNSYDRDLSGTAIHKTLRLKGLRLGSFRMQDVPMSIGEPRKASRFSLRFFTGFIVTFDFPNRALYLKKSRQFDRPYQASSGGIVFAREDADIKVEELRDGGPAAEAGIRVNDAVLKVGEQDASSARLFKLYDEFGIPGRTVHVRLLRGGEIIETEVKLPDDEEKVSEAQSTQRSRR